MFTSAMPVTAADLADEPSAMPVAAAELPGEAPVTTVAAAETRSGAPAATFDTLRLKLSGVDGANRKVDAVDGVNSKVDAFGGSMGSGSIYGVRSALSIPLSAHFGAQLDASAGRSDGRDFSIFAGHLFWRHPSQGLIGVFASHARWDRYGAMRANHFAAEGELYRGPITFRAVAGRESGNSGSRVVGGIIEAFDVRRQFFGNINVALYLQHNYKVFAGLSHLGGSNALNLGGEWALPVRGGVMASVFAEGAVGEDRFDGAWVGVKLYFAKAAKTLIRRHREDDPIFFMPDPLFTLLNSTTLAPFVPPTFVPPPPSPPPQGDGGESPRR